MHSRCHSHLVAVGLLHMQVVVQQADHMGFLLAGRKGYRNLGCIGFLLEHKGWLGRSCLGCWPHIAVVKDQISDSVHQRPISQGLQNGICVQCRMPEGPVVDYVMLTAITILEPVNPLIY